MDKEKFCDSCGLSESVEWISEILHNEAKEIVQGLYEVDGISMEDIYTFAQLSMADEKTSASYNPVVIAILDKVSDVALSGEY